MSKVQTFYFVRHGESLSQADRTVVVGRAAEQPLTETGRRQAQALAVALSPYPLEAIYASTCLRALETAEPIAQAKGLALGPTDLLVERSHGVLEGRKKDEAYTPELVQLIHADQLRWRPEGGESLEDVAERLQRFLDGVPERCGVVFAVTHLMVLWALFWLCTGCQHAFLPHLRVDNAGLVEIERYGDGTLRLIRWNQRMIRC